MHLSGSLNDRRYRARIKNQVSSKVKLGVGKEQNGFILAKEVRRDVTLLARVLHIKVGFITFFVHSSCEENPSPLIINFVAPSFF